jgi:hypothetical protein
MHFSRGRTHSFHPILEGFSDSKRFRSIVLKDAFISVKSTKFQCQVGQSDENLIKSQGWAISSVRFQENENEFSNRVTYAKGFQQDGDIFPIVCKEGVIRIT